MTKVFFGIGSNIKPEENIVLAVREIKDIFDDVIVSPVYKNKSVITFICSIPEESMAGVIIAQTSFTP